jgi:endonuclease/exonuclease/phosphatase family metal-dependent hydrolase
MKFELSVKGTVALSLAIILVGSAIFLPFLDQASAVRQVQGRLKVMTWNLSDGADLAPVLAATTQQQLVAAVGAAYNGIVATNFAERAKVIAKQIEIANPDIIGLQEAIMLRTQTPADGPATPASNISYDHLQILIDNLEERGLHYRVAVNQTGTDIEAPGLFTTGLMDVRLTDRDAILVRDNAETFTVSNPQSSQFAAKITLSSLVGPIALPKSWVSVEVTLNSGEKAKVVSAHLEPLSPAIQVAQAAELASGPANTALPVILIGDFNSKADSTGTQTYPNLISAGFSDAWSIRGTGNGFTCCQESDLNNSASLLNSRIDLVLFKGNFEVKYTDLVGESNKDKTSGGLWPSDHAGVVADLKLKT